jgi:glyoxylase-like metal-dependent hydrolase (beta-lactamase superfamily II)
LKVEPGPSAGERDMRQTSKHGKSRYRQVRGLLLSALCCCGTAAGAAPQADPFEVRLEQLAEGIYVAIRPVSTRQPVMGNGTIIVNDDHVVVVDGNGSPLLADRVIAAIRSVTDRPVRYLVVSHWHGDHNLGNHRYLAAWPDLEIIGHRFAREAMLGAPMDYVEEYKVSIPEQMQVLAERLQSGVGSDGEPLEDYQRRELEDLVRHGDVFLGQIQASRVTPPTMTFERELVLHGGGRRIEIRHPGEANTAGDAYVWLPDERILVSGDIVVHPTPYGFYSYPRSWAAVLEGLQALQPRIVVPGHGEPMRDTAYLARLQALFSDLADQAAAAVAAGRSLEEFRAALDFEAHRAGFTGDDPFLDSRWTVWFTEPIAEAAWNEAAGIDNELLVKP